jgi:copper chaperone CopZ
MQGTSYIHMLEGRLRIKVSEIKGSVDKAVEVEATIRELEGVTHVKANSVTGNVLVLFDSDETNHYHIIGTLKDLGCLRTNSRTVQTHSHSQGKWAEAVVGPIAQMVIERAILALI